MEAAIRVDKAITTLVNVFTVEPDNQPKAIALLQEGIENAFSKMSGWISSNVLKSKDGRQVVIYSQWRDVAAIDRDHTGIRIDEPGEQHHAKRRIAVAQRS